MRAHVRFLGTSWSGRLLVSALLVLPCDLRAQSEIRRAADPQYRAGSVQQFFLGHGYRDLWTTPITVPVLDPAQFGGALTAERAGGGNQTKTLRFSGGDGRSYLFRSTEKFAGRPLPEDLRGTVVEAVLQDQISALNPAAPLVVPRLLAAVGLLHVTPRMIVLPDGSYLGESRDDFAGMLGHIEERPDEGANGLAGFAEAQKIADAEEMIEHLHASSRHRLREQEWIAARLIDFVIGDTDRGPDQWRFAGYERADSTWLWRPIPRDRDFALANADGLLPRLLTPLIALRLPRFNRTISVNALTATARRIDRAFTTHSTRAVFESVALEVRQRLSDDVIEAAVADLPPEYQAPRGAQLTAVLRARRDQIVEAADRWYAVLASEIDVYGTNEADVLDVERHGDGSVTVTLMSAPQRMARAIPTSLASSSNLQLYYYQRRFIPTETREVRIYLFEGNDHALVHGAAPSSMRVRVIGGNGDDTLVDASRVRARGKHTVFYDDAGRNNCWTTDRTRLEESTFVAPPASPEWTERRLGAIRHRDAGTSQGLAMHLDYSEGAYVVIGLGVQRTRYGFRHVPYEWHGSITGLYAVGANDFGVQLLADKHFENSNWTAALRARASQFEATRFYGYGNNTPDDEDLSLVMRDEISVEPSLTWQPNERKRATFTMIARYTNPRPDPVSPLARTLPDEMSAFGQVGVHFNGEIDQSGVDHRANGLAVALDGRVLTDPAEFSPYARLAGEARAYAAGALAVRIGGAATFGPAPFTDAAFVGGGATLRGFRYQRFAGDAALYGGVEARVPVARITLLTHGQLRALGFADAGRVYFDGESAGNWHAGVGGGLAFTSIERTVSITYARGEHGRVYVSTGMPF